MYKKVLHVLISSYFFVHYPASHPGIKTCILSMLETYDGKPRQQQMLSLVFSHLLETHEFRSSYSCLYEISFPSF